METRIVRKPIVVKSRNGNYYKKYNNYVEEEQLPSGEWVDYKEPLPQAIPFINRVMNCLVLGAVGSILLYALYLYL